MNNIENNFFEGKRSWSKLKDEVIQKYLPPYLKKVNKLNERIILLDSFAGPGKFDDDSKGSPLYICELAEQFVPENYLAILVNKNQSHHQKLETVLSDYIKNKKAIAIRGKAEDLLQRISTIIKTETIFIYLDPFGLRGTDYHLLKYFLDRSQRYSTELIINVSIPTILRLSSINSYNENGLTEAIESKHKSLSKALGGDYWKGYLLDKSIPKEIRINLLLEDYKNRLTSFLPEVGFCPVYEKNEISTMKYCIFFASRHPDAKLLMNDIMFSAYSNYIWKRNYEDTLFGVLEWDDNLPDEYFSSLEDEIITHLSTNKIQRINLWKQIVDKNFMKYHHKHFNVILKKLIKNKKVDFDDVKGSGKLNNISLIYLKN